MGENINKFSPFQHKGKLSESNFERLLLFDLKQKEKYFQDQYSMIQSLIYNVSSLESFIFFF